MRKVKYLLYVITVSLLIMTSAVLSQNEKSGEEINWQVMSNGGAEMVSTNYILNGTLSQMAVGEAVATNYKIRHGFWQNFASENGPCQGRCGDANYDGYLDVSDAIFVINYVFIAGSPPPQPVLSCGDANGDESMDISDAVYIINYVFVAESPPPGDCSAGLWGGEDCCPF